MTVPRITAAYYEPRSGAIRVLSETSEQVGYIDTKDLADLFLRSFGTAVINMHVETALKEKPAGRIDYQSWHKGRAWAGHEIEDACPCPQEPCGLVSTPDPNCDQHSLAAGKSIRQGHSAENCPGRAS